MPERQEIVRPANTKPSLIERKPDDSGGHTKAELEEKLAKATKSLMEAPRLVKITDIHINPRLASFWDIEESDLQGIVESMRERGYDKAEPIVLHVFDDGKLTLIDGHTRTRAASECGFEEVWAVVLVDHFKDIEEAEAYMYSRQLNRRNLSDLQRFKKALNFNPKFDKSRGSKKEKLARLIGKKPTVAHYYLYVIEHGKEYHEQILNGEISVSRVYSILNPKKPEETADELAQDESFEGTVFDGGAASSNLDFSYESQENLDEKNAPTSAQGETLPTEKPAKESKPPEQREERREGRRASDNPELIAPVFSDCLQNIAHSLDLGNVRRSLETMALALYKDKIFSERVYKAICDSMEVHND